MRRQRMSRDERGQVELVVIPIVVIIAMVFAIGVFSRLAKPNAEMADALLGSLVMTAFLVAAGGAGLLALYLVVGGLYRLRNRRVRQRMNGGLKPTFSGLAWELGLPHHGGADIEATLEAVRVYWEQHPHQSLAMIVESHASAMNRALGVRRPVWELEDQALRRMLLDGTGSTSAAARDYVQA